jgi:hypothetical protein
MMEPNRHKPVSSEIEAEIDAALGIDRHGLQSQGKHPAPCARWCEATAFKSEIRQLTMENEKLRKALQAQVLQTMPDGTVKPVFQQRQPLTDEQIDHIGRKLLGVGYGGNTDRDFARAIEAAHGIGEKK